MENEESDAADERSAEQAGATAGVHYVAAAPLIEVLFEQLEYLSMHLTEGDDCPSACPVCARLNEVSRFLLAPFRNPLNPV